MAKHKSQIIENLTATVKQIGQDIGLITRTLTDIQQNREQLNKQDVSHIPQSEVSSEEKTRNADKILSGMDRSNLKNMDKNQNIWRLICQKHWQISPSANPLDYMDYSLPIPQQFIGKKAYIVTYSNYSGAYIYSTILNNFIEGNFSEDEITDYYLIIPDMITMVDTEVVNLSSEAVLA